MSARRASECVAQLRGHLDAPRAVIDWCDRTSAAARADPQWLEALCDAGVVRYLLAALRAAPADAEVAQGVLRLLVRVAEAGAARCAPAQPNCEPPVPTVLHCARLAGQSPAVRRLCRELLKLLVAADPAHCTEFHRHGGGEVLQGQILAASDAAEKTACLDLLCSATVLPPPRDGGPPAGPDPAEAVAPLLPLLRDLLVAEAHRPVLSDALQLAYNVAPAAAAAFQRDGVVDRLLELAAGGAGADPDVVALSMWALDRVVQHAAEFPNESAARSLDAVLGALEAHRANREVLSAGLSCLLTIATAVPQTRTPMCRRIEWVVQV